MQNKPFIINDRFLVKPEFHTITDHKTGKELRTEPRLMSVLVLLSLNVDKLVSRGQLIKDIWADYGGGDEGLSQAISFLRKQLEDTNKKIIETVPTKGYKLNAVITEDSFFPNKSKKHRYWVAALLFLIIATLILFLFSPLGKPSIASPVSAPKPGKAPSPNPSPKPFN
ncbi:DNA-binding winged helix-turn-helix (wHTH) domain-containing protein [Mucilaginibacter lappiensis]|uniref:DNA-binding winged helix-turn-helix (WHTH) protein n=1 Tax=Mucilaginibacter lappiensis TaxID=354630 RepID=A0ABR6PH76_9SPHI|nr:winged helix-turn-helix domain-containing protein [Mucilaginibacter lappiensis]MBB6108599.1 DNA-binding winged helix-turn-helix (wHTH) protein [Mucilaginibacter lappiensis]SIQ31356.1 DNA-binding winged helix-turn-helix (wHTH) domain-containing protein [Mucilaginibacter lappiensis]